MTPWVMRLLVANVVVFMLSMNNRVMVETFMFVPNAIFVRPWTVVSYMFLHAGFGHLFFNMLGLYFFGPRLEQRLGGASFVRLYFFSGFGGAVFSFLFSPFAPIIGASGAVYGVLLSFAMLWPKDSIYIWGVLPIQSRWLVTVMAVLSISGGFGKTGDNIAHFAHLGGFVAAFLYMRAKTRNTEGQKFKQKASGATDAVSASTGNLKKWQSINRAGMHEINRDELDRILDKIGSEGGGSLSVDERAFLERFSPG